MDRARRCGLAHTSRIQEWQLEQKRRQHKRNLRHMAPMVRTQPQDTGLPTKAQGTSRGAFLREQRQRKIDRDNMTLLERMETIRQDKTNKGIDCHNEAPPGSRSLSGGRRRDQDKRIQHENMRMLARLHRAQPTAKRADWMRHAREHEDYLASACEKPQVLHIQNNAEVDDELFYDMFHLP